MSGARLAPLAAGLLVLACGGDDPRTPEPQSDASATVASDSSLDSTSDTTPPSPTTASPLAAFGLDFDDAPTTDTRTVPLLLRNDGPSDALVYADAGSGAVRIDSVPAGTRVRVDVETTAPRFALHSTTADGRELRRTEVSTEPGVVREILVGADPGP